MPFFVQFTKDYVYELPTMWWFLPILLFRRCCYKWYFSTKN